MPPLVSVIINNYNYAAFVGRAIDSALFQQGFGSSGSEPRIGGVEVIVVDDGSTDASGEVLDRYAGRVTVLRKENGGQASALNAGVRASAGDLLCFLDADDWWTPDKLAAVVARFQADPGLALVYHRLQPVRVDGSPTLRPIPRTLCSGDLRRRMERSAGWWPFPMTSAVAVRRSAWHEAGDIPASFRISADAWLVGIYPFLGRVGAIPDSLGHYRIHNNNWYRASDDEGMLRRRMAHWDETVRVTNAFLAQRGEASRLSLNDHLPYHAASARLGRAGIAARLRLTVRGLAFEGEPHPLRRARDAVRLLRAPRPGGGAEVPLGSGPGRGRTHRAANDQAVVRRP